MADLNIRLEIRLSPRILQWALAALLISLTAGELSSENVTLTTYYPAPSGVYNQMITTQATYLARDAGRVGIGTVIPGYKLDVQDSVPANGTINASGNISSGGNLTAAGVMQASGGGSSYVGGKFGADNTAPAADLDVGPVGNNITQLGVIISRQVGSDCSFLPYSSSPGVLSCPGGKYITYQQGLISKYVAAGALVPTGVGTALCCVCPSGVCPSLN